MWKSRIIKMAYVMAVVGGAALILGPILARVDYRIGFALLAASAVLAALGALTGLIGTLWSVLSSPRDELGRAALSFVISIAVIAIPVSMALPGIQAGYPPIHDITTDTENPPQFSAVMAARGEGSNSVDYDAKFVSDSGPGGEYAGKHYSFVQQDYYSDIKTLSLQMSPTKAFAKAVNVAEDLGWEVVDKAPNTGRIEATDTTFWLGFKDDVVIRITSEGSETRVDLRSTSRVGMGDIGANAIRVRAFLAAMQED